MGQVTRLGLSPAPAGTHRDTRGHPLCWLPSRSLCCARLGKPQRSRERAQGRIYILCLSCAAVSVTRSGKVGSHVYRKEAGGSASIQGEVWDCPFSGLEPEQGTWQEVQTGCKSPEFVCVSTLHGVRRAIIQVCLCQLVSKGNVRGDCPCFVSSCESWGLGWCCLAS